MRAYDEDGFYRRATEALSQTSDEAASTLTVALTECFPVRAANLYCYAPQVRHIVLRGCAGLDVTAFRSFEKDLNSTVAARAIDSGEIQIVDDIQAHPKFIEKGLASTYSLRAAIITPLAYTDGDADRPIVPLKGEERPHAYGVLTVFPDADAEGDRDVLADVMTRLGPFVAAACAASVRNDKVALRTELLGVAPGGRDLYSAFGAAIPRLAKKLCVEGCSIFLWDAASALLRLYGTTGLQSQLLPGDVHYTHDEARRTVDVATTGQPFLTHDLPAVEDAPGKYVEHVAGARKSYVSLPVFDANYGVPHVKPPLGAVRFINRVATIGCRSEAVALARDDLSKLAYVAELLGVVANFLMTAERAAERVERTLHGARTSIEAATQNLSRLVTSRSAKQTLAGQGPGEGPADLAASPTDTPYITIHEPRYAHSVHNALAYIEDLKWQAQRSARAHGGPVPLRTGQVRLASAVLMPALRWAEKVKTSYQVRWVQVTNLHDAGFFRLPDVKGDADALLTVFRNLFDNAMKYMHQGPDTCRIELAHRISNDHLHIGISDFGIGLRRNMPGIEQRIFIDGYRTEDAIRRQPAGGGVGLAQSLELMVAMGGDLTCDLGEPGRTTFRVTMPRWKGDA